MSTDLPQLLEQMCAKEVRKRWIEEEYVTPEKHAGWKFYRAWNRRIEMSRAAGIKGSWFSDAPDLREALKVAVQALQEYEGIEKMARERMKETCPLNATRVLAEIACVLKEGGE